MTHTAATVARVEGYITKFTNSDVIEQVRKYDEESQGAVYDFIMWAGNKYNLNKVFGLETQKMGGE